MLVAIAATFFQISGGEAISLIWIGLAAAYTSVVTLLLTILYVIPAYVLYIKAEERMLLTRYGEEYRVYRRRVGALMPRVRRP